MPANAEGSNQEALPAELADADASPDILALYDEIRAVLRVPFVDQLWRVLARCPGVLQPVWAWLAPQLGCVQAERAADELRQRAVIPLALGLPAHKAFRGDMSRAEIGYDDREKISNFTMAAHYVLPKLLLAAALLDGAVVGFSSTASGADPLQPLQRGVAAGMPRIEPIDPAEARGQIPGLFAEIRAGHGYDALSDYFRTIARAGDFLRVSWNPLRPVVGDPEYLDCAEAVAARAAELAADLASLSPPPPAALGTGQQRDAVIAIARFQHRRLLPETLIEVTIIKGLTDGPDGAAQNLYSLTEARWNPADRQDHPRGQQ